MTIERSKAVAFTGHRDKGITMDTETLSVELRKIVTELYQKFGYTTFLDGMAQGLDMLAAEAVLEVKKEYPEIRLIAVVPFTEQSGRFSKRDKRRYKIILEQADLVVILSHNYFNGCFHRRNDYLVDNASSVVCYFNDNPQGGTYYTVQRAINQGIAVRNIAQKEKLGFGMFGNGVAVWDNTREKNNDYLKVAHINYDRTVQFYDQSLSITAKAQIIRFALNDNMSPIAQPEFFALKPIEK